MKAIFKILLRISITIGLFFYLFYFLVDFSQLVNTAKEANPLYLFLAFITLIITVFLSAWRWKMLLDLKKLSVPFRVVLKEYLVGFYFNNFLPTSIGGDVVRFMNVAAYTGKKTMVLASVITERVIGFIALVLITNIGVFFLKAGSDYRLMGLSFIFTGVFMIIFVILISRRLNRRFSNFLVKFIPNKLKLKVMDFFASFNTYSEQRAELVKNLLVSIVFRLFEGLFVYLIVLSLNVKMSYLYTLVLHSIVTVIKLTPSINGLGISEFSWVNLSDASLVSPEQATTLSLLVYFSALVLSMVGGILNFTSRKKVSN